MFPRCSSAIATRWGSGVCRMAWFLGLTVGEFRSSRSARLSRASENAIREVASRNADCELDDPREYLFVGTDDCDGSERRDALGENAQSCRAVAAPRPRGPIR